MRIWGTRKIPSEFSDRITPEEIWDTCQRTTVEGLGGVAKTQMAVENAFRFVIHIRLVLLLIPVIGISTFENVLHRYQANS